MQDRKPPIKVQCTAQCPTDAQSHLNFPADNQFVALLDTSFGLQIYNLCRRGFDDLQLFAPVNHVRTFKDFPT